MVFIDLISLDVLEKKCGDEHTDRQTKGQLNDAIKVLFEVRDPKDEDNC